MGKTEMTPLMIVTIFAILFGLAVLIIIFMFKRNAPKNTPTAFLKQGRQPETNTLVVCAGDSITYGAGSANWVNILQLRLNADGYQFVNAGIDGNLAWNVLQRVDDIIACQPDVVTLLVGTNDVNATLSQQWEKRYRFGQKIPEKPTLDWYRENIERIVDRLQSETNARIALIEIPMLGEDLNSEINQRVNAYNGALKTIAADKNVTLLPLHERLCAALPPDHIPTPYEGKVSLIFKTVIQHHILRQSWDHIASSNRLHLLTDHIHLNDKAGKIMADLINEYLANTSGNKFYHH